MDQEKPKIEVTEDPEYSDLLIDNIMFHGNNIRNPKEWYPELLYNSKLEQGARIYTNKNKVAVYPVDGVGMIIEQRFALSEKQKEVYREALTSGRAFKIYVRPDKTVKILFDNGAQEQVRAFNRRAGYTAFDESISNKGMLGQFTSVRFNFPPHRKNPYGKR